MDDYLITYVHLQTNLSNLLISDGEYINSLVAQITPRVHGRGNQPTTKAC